jgi:hypothetical protein
MTVPVPSFLPPRFNVPGTGSTVVFIRCGPSPQYNGWKGLGNQTPVVQSRHQKDIKSSKISHDSIDTKTCCERLIMDYDRIPAPESRMGLV